MATGAIEELSDAELRDLARRAQHVLEQRQAKQRRDAVEQARGILAAVGLSFAEAEAMGGAPKAKPAAAARSGPARTGPTRPAKARGRRGQRFVNPDDPSQSWTAGSGRPPKWLAKLEAEGRAPKAEQG